MFAGIAPWNFPAMIPMGWMAPLCIATGNTMVLKAASFTPQTSMRICELWAEAGLPKGVLNLVTCSRNEAEILLQAPGRQGGQLRRVHLGRAAHLRHGRGQRQAGAGADRGQEPRAGAAGRGAGADGAGHHQLGLRLRGRALHGAAGGCGGGGDRRPAGGGAGEGDAGAEDRAGLRQDEPAGAAGERRAPPVGGRSGSRRASRKGRSWCWTAAA